MKKMHVCFNIAISFHYVTSQMEVVLNTMSFKQTLTEEQNRCGGTEKEGPLEIFEISAKLVCS